MRHMAATGTGAVLLPTAFLHLKEKQLPPIDVLRRHGVPVALASDCNPGSSPSPSIQLAAALASRLFSLTPSETLAGMTRHAAHAMGEGAFRGVLKEGYAADFVAWDVESLDEIPYWMGYNRCASVVRNAFQVSGAAFTP